MEGLVRLRLGDLFDGPADLIVLPCSTSGTITRFVANRLIEYTIPRPKRGMELGDVEIMPFTGAENIAQYVAFAVSVLRMTSKLNAIQEIGRVLGRFTFENESVRTIAAPLLGAGAGGLRSEAVVESLSKGFRETAAIGAILTINILHKSVYDRLTRGNSLPDEPTPKAYPERPTRVFISYSGTSDRHKKWVAELGTFLRANGLNARLDQWHLRKGMDLPQWMTNELEMADRVMIISDSRYSERADGRTGGVGWETMLIQGDMSNLQPQSTKYLVIVREDTFDSGVPRYLKTKFCIHWKSDLDEDELRDDLLKELYNVNLEPPLGEPPTYYVAY
ncbi:MAG: TIR domain-containing protein [Candidatus Thiodiazotropha endolucinida]